MAKKMKEIGLQDVADDAKEAKVELNKLDSTLVSLGDKLDDLPDKIKTISQTISAQKRGVQKVVTILKTYDEQLKSTLNIKAVNDKITQIKTIPDQEKANKKTRGIVGYKGISESAELVRRETKLLSDGTRQLVEVFKKVDETGTTTYKAINKKIVDVSKNTQQVANDQEKANKKTSKFGILLNRIKTIAIYRTIRRGLQIITQSFTQSISNLAQYDENVNKSVSQITSAFTKMQNSVSVALYPVLEMLAPVIDNIANSIAGFANQISLANAQLTGQSTYLALNKDYWKDYSQSVKEANKQLLSFDKFEVLQQGNKTDVSELFETKQIDESTEQATESAKTLTSTLNSFPTILNSIFQVAKQLYNDIIKPVLPSLWDIIRWIVNFVAKIVTVLDDLGLLKVAIISIFALFTASKIASVFNPLSFKLIAITAIIFALIAVIKLVADNIEEIGEFFKKLGITIANFFIDMVNMLIGVVNTIASPINAIGRLFGASEDFAQIKQITRLSGGFEAGGIPEKSELFYMNEYGKPEAMMNLGGQTNVINQDQLRLNMKQGFVEAIYETGLLEAMQQGIIVEGRNIDNNSVARGLFNALKVESKRRGGNQL